MTPCLQEEEHLFSQKSRNPFLHKNEFLQSRNRHSEVIDQYPVAKNIQYDRSFVHSDRTEKPMRRRGDRIIGFSVMICFYVSVKKGGSLASIENNSCYE